MALIDGLISYWKLDESFGVNADDAHGANDGTTHDMEDADWVVGKINNALDFDGIDEYMDVGTMGNFGSNLASGFSVSFWIKTTEADLAGLLGVANFGTTQNVIIQLNTNSIGGLDVGKILMGLRDDDANRLSCAFTNDEVWRDGNWHHIVITSDGPNNLTKIYLDNSSKPITCGFAETPDNFVNFEYDLLIGAWNNRGTPTWFSDVTLDEIGMWNKILSPAEVAELWNGGNGLAYPFVVGTNMKINISDVFKDIESLKINIGNVWKDVVQVLQNIGGVWKNVFG